jgi:hypothetical protein
MSRRAVPIALIAPLLALAVLGSTRGASGTPRAGASVRVEPAGDHACIVQGSAKTEVAWSKLRNPIMAYPNAAAKDQALIWADGVWHMLFSYVTNDTTIAGQEHWGIATSRSSDLRHWSSPVPWSEQPRGMASPDVVRSPSGTFVSTYDSPPGESGPTQAKLYYRTSSDLVHWSLPHPLAPTLHPSPAVRMIDPALAWNGNGLILAYKVGTTSQSQAFEIAWSKSGSLSGPWRVIGRPGIKIYNDTLENYELLSLKGAWHLVATSNTLDQPWIFTLSGPPANPASWLHWMDGHQLNVPSETWNTGAGISSVNYEHANSAFLCQDTFDGYEYLTYAGSQELSRFGGRGHAEIGIARSKDLEHWTVPPN